MPPVRDAELLVGALIAWPEHSLAAFVRLCSFAVFQWESGLMLLTQEQQGSMVMLRGCQLKKGHLVPQAAT
jgi:hypothetical protein